MDVDPFFHRELTLRVRDRRLRLAVSQELFSSHTIDSGTLRLIKVLERLGLAGETRTLDLGCGYGPLGLAAAVLSPAGDLTMVDRDALAVEYAARNAESAGVANARVHGSLGYDDLSRDATFDLVVSNVPGKAPPVIHEELVAGAARYLSTDGVAAIVVVEPLTGLVDGILEAAGAEVLVRDAARAHTVFVHGFSHQPEPAASAFERGLYWRDRIDGVRTVWGLPEFDQLAFATSLALPLLGEGGDVAVVNPGQGHLPVACRASSVVAADRDLLALRTTAANLAAAGVDPRAVGLVHSARPPAWPAIDTGILSLRPKEPRELHALQARSLLAALRPDGRLLVCGPATHVGRLVSALGPDAKPSRTEQAQGHAAVELRPVRGTPIGAVQ